MCTFLLVFMLLPVEKDTVFSGNGTWGPYVISSFLLRNTFEVTLNDTVASFSISYDRGVLFFNRPITEDDTVRCHYTTLPFRLQNHYYKWRETADTSKNSETVEITEIPQEEQIRFGGEKRFSISLGNKKDLSIDQSTRLCVEGKISEDLRIEGELSDESLPLDPDGTTQDLRDFEKAYIKVGGDNISFLLGDTDISFNPGHSHNQSIERKIEGMNFEFRRANYSCDATVSLAKGSRKKVRFEGKAGKQGPYILSRQKQIVSSSEKVYVDGRQLKDGREYIIDYETSELKFKSIFPIAGGEDILVYFEEADGDYRREVYGLEASTLNDLSIEFGLFRESDDGNHPTTISLSEDDKEILSSATDSIVWLPGSKYVGENNGDYFLNDSIFVFAGYKKGNWNVKFSEKDKGDYDYNNSLGGFEFVGRGNGDFVPYIRIPLPRGYTISKVSLTKGFGNSTISIEGLLSINDVNTLHDGSERYGSNGNLSYKSKGYIYQLDASLWSCTDDFYYPDGMEEWGRGYGLKLDFIPWSWTLFNGYIEGGKYHRGNLNLVLGSEKKGISCIWNRELRFTERRLKGYYWITNFLPYLYIGDIQRADLKSKVYGAGVERNRFSLEINEERKDTLSIKWQRFQRTENAILGFHPGDFNINLIYRYGKKWEEDYNLLMGSLSGFLNTSYANIQLDYDVSRTEKTLYDEFYYQVEDGKGNFSRDPSTGRYYYDEYGNYERRLIPCSSPQLMNQFYFLNIANMFPWEGTKVTIKTIKEGEGERISFWGKLAGITDKNHLSISTSIKNGLLTTYYSQQDVRDGRTIGNTRERVTTIFESGLNPSIYGYPLSLWFKQEKNLESYIDGEVIAEEGKMEVGGKADRSLKNLRFTLAITIGEQKIYDFLYSFLSPYVRLRYLKISPSFRYHRGNKDFQFDIEVTNRNEIEGNASCATKSLYPLGMSYVIGSSFTIMPKGNIHYVLDYHGRKREEYPFDHTVKVEARMFF